MVKKLLVHSSVLAMLSTALIAIVASPAFAATTYYVDAANGNDSTGTGSSASWGRS